ncbi:MAG TPA: hypothetical protein PKB06_04250, partial [Actinotalea sp.]|nr:hypothetical protein [Actinotalea sp.]
AAAATALADALAGAGVRSRDIPTTTTSSWTVPGDTVTDGGSAVSRLPRTTVRLGVEARLRDVAGAGDVIGVALEAGAGAVHLEGTSLLVDDTGRRLGPVPRGAFARRAGRASARPGGRRARARRRRRPGRCWRP